MSLDFDQNFCLHDQIKLATQHGRELSRLHFNLRRACLPPTTLDSTTQNISRMLERLERERDEIDLNLSVALGYADKDALKLREIQEKVDCQKLLGIEIKNVATEIAHLESQLKRLSNEELDLQKILLNEREHEENLKRNCVNLESSERNLNLAKMKEGKIMAENFALKNVIRTMIHDRNRFNGIWQKVVARLNANRKFLVDMMERAVLAFNQSEDLIHKIGNKKIKSEEMRETHVKDITQTRRQLQKDRNYQDFLGVKGRYRELEPLEDREVRRRAFVEEKLRKNVKMGQEIVQKVVEKSDFLEKNLLEYRKSKYFYFNHFNYLQLLNFTTEHLSQLLNNSNKSLSNHRKSSENAIIAKTTTFKDTYDALTQAQAKTSALNNSLDTTESYLNSILTDIQEICVTLDCESRFIDTLLGDHSKITLFNIKLFLYSLEQRVNSILSHIFHCNKTSISLPTKKFSVQDVTKLVTKHQCSECAERTSVKVYEETVVRPMSRNTIRKNLAESLKQSDIQYRLHTLSECRLPKSRILANKRYF